MMFWFWMQLALWGADWVRGWREGTQADAQGVPYSGPLT